jgi:hypothetical protein
MPGSPQAMRGRPARAQLRAGTVPARSHWKPSRAHEILAMSLTFVRTASGNDHRAHTGRDNIPSAFSSADGVSWMTVP